MSRLLKWLIGGGIVTLFGIIDYFSKWGILLWLGNLIKTATNIQWVLIITLLNLSFLTFLYYKFYITTKYLALSFKDNFKRDPKENWEFQNGWNLVPGGGEINITQSEMGGITRVGHLWRDYSFEFTAVIVTDRIGWIVRAQDLLNHYMIQLTSTQIRPHMRINGRWIVLEERNHNTTISINTPMKIRTTVRGDEIRVYINGEEVYSKPDLFAMKFITMTNQVLQTGQLQAQTIIIPPFLTGRVGFRMAGLEYARISKCRVKLI